MDVLIEVGEGALLEMGERAFTSREFGEILHESQQFLRPWERHPRPVRRGALAGQVLRGLRERGLVQRCPPRGGRAGWWQKARPEYNPYTGTWS